jgi:membrane associated rhomboid family serine protease
MPMFESGYYAAPAIMVLTLGISLLGLFQVPDMIGKFLFRPYFFVRDRQWDTMIMSGFIHADMMHLAFNMITFYFFAFTLERFLGTTKFVILYFGGLIISHTCTWLKERRNPQYASLGASGAISAVLFCYIVYDPTTMLLVFFIPMPALLFAILYVGYSMWASKNANDRINHDAHLCGALSGLGFVAITDPGAYSRLLSILF